MMQVFKRQRFERLRDRGSGRIYEDIQLHGCCFQGCVTVAKKPKRRPTFRNVRVVDCEQRGCVLRGAIVDGCLIENLRTNGLFQVWGSVFRHVTVRGRVDRIMVTALIGLSERANKRQAEFDDANAEDYAKVDWALDIREADFEECDLRGVPARLVLRDPETQVVVTRERALNESWRALDLSRTHWGTSLDLFLQRGQPDVVLVAGKRASNFSDLVAGLDLLRKNGVADAD